MTIESPPRRLTTTTFAAYLRRAMGLGLTAVGAVGCGGNVIVDEGAGGAATTTATLTATITGTTTTSTTTAFTCDTPATVYDPLTACVSPSPIGCQALESVGAYEAVFEELSFQGCGADVAGLLCGPFFNGDGQCCYVADAMIYECGGRPFMVEGAARVASIEVRGDWLSRAVAGAAELDETTRATLAAWWTRQALDEHAAVASFARFALELLSVGAPAEIVRSTQVALGEEITHAEICFGLASAYVGKAVGPGALPIEGAGEARATLAEIAAATAREGCVGETIAAFVAAAARDEATDPAARAALAVIARDEAEHAALAFRFVAWAVREGGPRVRASVDSAFRAAIAAPPLPLPEGEGDPARLRAHGVLPGAERRVLAERCLAEVIAPTARALVHEVAAGAPARDEVALA